MSGGDEKGITVYCVDSGNTQHAECLKINLNPLAKCLSF